MAIVTVRKSYTVDLTREEMNLIYTALNIYRESLGIRNDDDHIQDLYKALSELSSTFDDGLRK